MPRCVTTCCLYAQSSGTKHPLKEPADSGVFRRASHIRAQLLEASGRPIRRAPPTLPLPFDRATSFPALTSDGAGALSNPLPPSVAVWLPFCPPEAPGLVERGHLQIFLWSASLSWSAYWLTLRGPVWTSFWTAALCPLLDVADLSWPW